jgi:hypothetical protein
MTAMKRFILTTALMFGLGVGGGAWVSAQTAPAPKTPAQPPAAHVHPGHAPGMDGGMGMMGGGMGMMPIAMMGGGLCPMGMAGADTKVEVKNVDRGVSITLTSTDATRVGRLQKMAEAMRLMHEATAP